MNRLYILLGFLLFGCCKSDELTPYSPFKFGDPIKVEVLGYNGNIMEPFLSRDGNTLLFNNLNKPPENTNLHWAIKVNETCFQYKGEISGVNTTDLEGVPTMDSSGNLYFVSTRNYSNTLSTLYHCQYSNGVASNVQLLEGVSKLQAGWVNFDVEVSADGNFIYFVDAQLDQYGNILSADLAIAENKNSGFQRLTNSNDLLKNINTNSLEYAACISNDQLELYFTRASNVTTEIMVSTRKSISEPFGQPAKIQSITGFAEATTITLDQNVLYYHKYENNKFLLYMIKKV